MGSPRNRTPSLPENHLRPKPELGPSGNSNTIRFQPEFQKNWESSREYQIPKLGVSGRPQKNAILYIAAAESFISGQGPDPASVANFKGFDYSCLEINFRSNLVE
ncbi:dihydrolipoyllysine-residue acetyltransferase component of pyruvate dehydrogenase complex [Striga asiatica]|uniref:Dihydrolipoyllysine-residue acetyltransferase component of pyruvate dehydrogenase complex n=1 Tax=Striga asiatica TaxID=4170 RepID=A0A5A7Q5T9_STRAF|nr:dihydrolipoyllysine-residue acetyltransferase component of pyruvate dehydrogenase complex [Striga asiatica]